MAAFTASSVAEALLCGTATLGDGETVAFDGSVATDTLGASGVLTRGVYRLCATEDCWYKVGASPTAVAGEDGSAFLKAGVVDFVPIPASGAYKIAAIKDAIAGNLSIQECKIVGA